jgi:hypothetical protein
MEKITESVVFAKNAEVTSLFEVEELEQRMENSWTEYVEATTENGGTVQAGVSYNW